MKPFIITLAFIIGLTASPLQAAEPCNDVQVSVKGMVCDFCARALEKVFGAREEVSGITVDLDSGAVTVSMQPGKNIDDATLTKLITDSGYNVAMIDRGC